MCLPTLRSTVTKQDLTMLKIALLIVVSAVTLTSSQRRCYSCDQREAPGDCEDIATCSADEQCITDKFISEEGHAFYRLGCRPSRVCQILNQFAHGKREEITRDKRRLIHLCTRCCDSDYCNKDLCLTATATSAPTNQHQCYECDDLTDPEQCEVTKTCEPDELCFSEEYLNDNGEFRLNIGCQRKVVCTALTAALKEQQKLGRDTGVNHICNGCCEDDHCNLTPCKNITNAFVAGRH